VLLLLLVVICFNHTIITLTLLGWSRVSARGRCLNRHSAGVDLDVCVVVVVQLLFFINLGGVLSLTSVDGVFPTLVKLAVLASDAVVKHWRSLDGFEDFAGLLTVRVLVVRVDPHVHHVHHVLRVRVLLLPQIQLFKFLADRRCVSVGLNCAERPQRLFDRAILFRMSEALVLLNLRESLLFFKAELDVVEGFVGETHQVGRDRERELPEADLAVGLVAKTPQNSVDILLQNLLLKLEEVRLNVFEVQKPEVALVDHTEHRHRVELVQRLQSLLFDLDLHVVVDLLFKEARKFKLDVTLETVVASNVEVLSLRNFGSQADVVHREHHLQEAGTGKTKLGEHLFDGQIGLTLESQGNRPRLCRSS